MAALAMPMAALAADTGTTEISGSISAVLELTAPSNITLGTAGVMAVGDNLGNSTDGNVNCNYADGYTLTVQDAMANISATAKDATIAGKMWTGLTGTTLVLADPFYVGVAGYMSLTALTASPQIAKPTSAPSYNDAFTLRVSQTVANTDPAGSYSIALLFTATAN